MDWQKFSFAASEIPSTYRTGTRKPVLILHPGLGAFHRAHQAAYLQDLIDNGEHGWTIVAANIRPDPSDPSAQLLAQGCGYTLETVTPAGEFAYRRIGAIARCCHSTPARER